MTSSYSDLPHQHIPTSDGCRGWVHSKPVFGTHRVMTSCSTFHFRQSPLAEVRQPGMRWVVSRSPVRKHRRWCKTCFYLFYGLTTGPLDQQYRLWSIRVSGWTPRGQVPENVYRSVWWGRKMIPTRSPEICIDECRAVTPLWILYGGSLELMQTSHLYIITWL